MKPCDDVTWSSLSRRTLKAPSETSTQFPRDAHCLHASRNSSDDTIPRASHLQRKITRHLQSENVRAEFADRGKKRKLLRQSALQSPALPKAQSLDDANATRVPDMLKLLNSWTSTKMDLLTPKLRIKSETETPGGGKQKIRCPLVALCECEGNTSRHSNFQSKGLLVAFRFLGLFSARRRFHPC